MSPGYSINPQCTYGMLVFVTVVVAVGIFKKLEQYDVACGCTFNLVTRELTTEQTTGEVEAARMTRSSVGAAAATPRR